MTHSIGVDSARMVLDAYQAAEKINGPRDRRFRMEHADYLHPEDIPRFRELSVIASMQPSFCCNAGELGRVKIDAWNSLLKAGAMLTFSSDWPCTWPPDPLAAIEETATREILRDITPHGPVGEIKYDQPQERLSIEQSVLAYTRDAAYANFAEHLFRQARRHWKHARHHDDGWRQDRLSAIGKVRPAEKRNNLDVE